MSAKIIAMKNGIMDRETRAIVDLSTLQPRNRQVPTGGVHRPDAQVRDQDGAEVHGVKAELHRHRQQDRREDQHRGRHVHEGADEEQEHRKCDITATAARRGAFSKPTK